MAHGKLGGFRLAGTRLPGDDERLTDALGRERGVRARGRLVDVRGSGALLGARQRGRGVPGRGGGVVEGRDVLEGINGDENRTTARVNVIRRVPQPQPVQHGGLVQVGQGDDVGRRLAGGVVGGEDGRRRVERGVGAGQRHGQRLRPRHGPRRQHTGLPHVGRDGDPDGVALGEGENGVGRGWGGRGRERLRRRL